jgi:hypothetical protein
VKPVCGKSVYEGEIKGKNASLQEKRKLNLKIFLKTGFLWRKKNSYL